MARIEGHPDGQFRSLRKLWRSGTTEGSLRRPKAKMAAFFTSRSGLFVSAKMSGSAHFSGVRRERKGWRFSRRRPGPRAIRAGGFGPFFLDPGQNRRDRRPNPDILVVNKRMKGVCQIGKVPDLIPAKILSAARRTSADSSPRARRICWLTSGE